MVDQGYEGAGCKDRHIPGPSRLWTGRFWTDQAKAHPIGGDGGRKGPHNRRNLTIKAKLANDGPAIEAIGWDNAHRRHDG